MQPRQAFIQPSRVVALEEQTVAPPWKSSAGISSFAAWRATFR